jgi:nitroreductase
MDGYPVMANERCIKCQHCLAVCPTGALSILGNDPDDSTPLKGNLPQPQQLATLIKGRRSVRRYRDENVDSQTIRELLDIAWHAPTGVNLQSVRVTLMADKASTQALKKEVYRRLAEVMESGNMADTPMLQYLGGPVRKYFKDGTDPIFRNTPHFIVATAASTSPTPASDTNIFLATFELMACSKGLGTQWNGMLAWCINSIFPDIREKLGIPSDHLIGGVMSFGIPAVTYQRTVDRGEAKVTLAEWS